MSQGNVVLIFFYGFELIQNMSHTVLEFLLQATLDTQRILAVCPNNCTVLCVLF